ncbi:MAG: T9SS type A sorting domain-containing protein [Rhizobacter sp.]|nr:T9SS type A sorting domain-containing protein [Ferruginibacter sp.]
MKNFYAALVFFFVVQVSIAQVSPAYQNMQANEIRSGQILMREPNQSELIGLDYDVKYYRIEVRINPDSTGPAVSPGKYIKGAVTTYFTTLAPNFGQVKFDFANSLICDSVQYHGAKLNASNITEQTDTLEISIPTIVAAGTLDSIKVFYKGIPPVVTDFGGSTGYVKGSHSSGNYIYTLSEPYSASTWWPCKSKVAADKADSVDIIVSTPSAFMTAANGKRISEVINGADKITTWKHRYPISSYQVAIGVAYYEQWPVTPTIVNIGGTNMDLYNLLWIGTNTAAARTALGRTSEMLTVFSNRFSDYPFKKEKYGHYTFGFGGGMEHNTFSGMGPTTYDAASDWSVIAHELGHQWFGASVTCGSWRDIWVNESFARYSEIVYLENKTDPSITATAFSHRTSLKNTSLANNLKPIFQQDTSTMTTIFNPSVYIYDRGAMFISMLRKTLGDTNFYKALQNYQTDLTLKNSNAFTDDVKRHMEAVSGLDLTEMFDDWIYKKGHALYNGAKWNNFGNQVVLQLPQTVNGPSDNTHFDLPVVIRFIKTSAPTRDTTITLFDKGGVLYKVNDGVFSSASGGNLIQVSLPFVPSRIVFDSLAETLSAGAFTKDATLALLATNVVSFSAQKENNNAKLLWSIDQTLDYQSFEIERSTNGTLFEKIATQTAAQNNEARNFNFTDYNIPAGIVYYRIKIVERNGSSFNTRIASINNKITASFVVTPNPASDHINISHGAEASITVNVKITDAAGRVVKSLAKQSIATGNKLRIPLMGFAAGTYYVEIEGEEYFKIVKKIALIK